MANRKLIRPNLSELKEQLPQRQPRKKPVPPSQTHAESFYYLKQMNNHTPMVLVLLDGEKLYGYIEWYDLHCIKFNRDDEPNLLVPKRNIKYLYKQEEE
jgi:sRNA-binding regulator protein Hfq